MTRLPMVAKCDEADCFYNHGAACHAPAINVGATHPRCDTYSVNGRHIARTTAGVVGACHVAECRWNRELICRARAIVVGHHVDHPDCLTFELAK